ncbi:alpha-galactosidase [Streptomyces sp. AC555_RSS877]|uniref:alpha-galactosidase n=1 Tax=Streptomyces sp. AC555_RSS877 TaxID=2823688 RepID=UPI0035AC1C9C
MVEPGWGDEAAPTLGQRLQRRPGTPVDQSLDPTPPAPRTHRLAHRRRPLPHHRSTHDLAFRAGTALFGNLGLEWDLTRTTETERAELASWIALYKQLRGLLHTGRLVRIDHPDSEPADSAETPDLRHTWAVRPARG